MAVALGLTGRFSGLLTFPSAASLQLLLALRKSLVFTEYQAEAQFVFKRVNKQTTQLIKVIELLSQGATGHGVAGDQPWQMMQGSSSVKCSSSGASSWR